MIATQCTVLTPAGTFQAQWDDDEDAPVKFAGSAQGIDYFRGYMAAEVVTGEGGIRLAADSVSPVDLLQFCPSPEHGITVLPSEDDALSDLQADVLSDLVAAEQVQAALDSVSPMDRLRLVKALGDATAALAAAGSPIARVKAAKSVADVLAKLGVGAARQDDAPNVDPEDDGLSDDPAAANYRYKDTGYIADSRKERAASLIRVAKAEGQRVRATDIDWAAIEQNPRQAAELIVKSNLFGKTDWPALRDAGMDPGAAFLIEKVYASIGPEPATALPKVTVQALSGGLTGARDLQASGALDRDSPEAMAQTRKDYALGLETIRERLEACRTTDDVLGVIGEIRDELMGVTLSADQADEMAALEEQYQAKRKVSQDAKAEYEAEFAKWRQVTNELNSLKYEQGKRANKKWKPDPELDRKIAELEPLEQAAEQAFRDYQGQHPEMQNRERKYASGGVNYLNDLEYEAYQVRNEIDAIRRQAKYFNLLSNPATRAWLSFGERFFKLLNYRSARGSDAFGTHVTSVRMGKVKDWGWSEKDRAAPKTRKPTEESINFQLRVAEDFERRGGRNVAAASTQALKDMMGLRDVQSGNWVLRDPASAKFHVEQTAAAMSDMADVLGIDMKHLGLGGRLGMAFGARGSGGKGAARAHYEPVLRVVNLTKMGGGGALGHELFHAIDNILPSLINGTAGAKDEFASNGTAKLPAGPVAAAFDALYTAMTFGSRRLTETVKITDKDRETARLNIDRGHLNQVAKMIKDAGSAEAAALAVTRYFAGREDKRSLRNLKQWRTLAVAYYAPADVAEVKLPVGRAVSDFMAEAQILDAGSAGKYWSSREEMAARAFQSYLEDRLADQDRRNDYLSALADNKFHVDPLFGIEWKPYPEGEERTRINAAFDQLFTALRDEKVFERASQNEALLDAIFGPADGVLDAVAPELVEALRNATTPLEKIRAARAIAAAIESSNSESLTQANANEKMGSKGATSGDKESDVSNESAAEAKAIEAEIATTFTGHDSKRLSRAVESFAAGFKTQAALKDAVADAGRLYDEMRSRIHAAYLDIPHEQRTEAQGAAYDVPLGLHQWRGKHGDAVLRAFPDLAAQVAVIGKLYRLRELFSAGTITPVASKAQVQREKAAAALGSMDPSVNDLVAKLQVLKPGLSEDFREYVTRELNALLEKYGSGEKLSDLGNSGGPDGMTYRQFNRFYEYKGDWRGREVSSLNAEAIGRAAQQYADDQIAAFTTKLVLKIGNLTSVTVHDLSASGFTFTISGKLGERKVLVEQSRIINQSANGLLFHQWPARIYVDGKFMSELAYRAVSGGVK